MATLDGKSLVVLANLAGFSPHRKYQGIGHDRWAAAVALAESGGNPKAHNKVPPDDSYGLWQINMIGSLGPARRKQFGISSNEALFDAQVNAAAAFVVYKRAGYSFRPWSTFPARAALKLGQTAGVSEKDRKFFYEGRADIIRELDKWEKVPEKLATAITETSAEAIGALAKNITKTLSEDVTGLGFLTDWLEEYALRAAAFVGGGILLVLGLVMLAGQANTVQAAAKSVVRAGRK